MNKTQTVELVDITALHRGDLIRFDGAIWQLAGEPQKLPVLYGVYSVTLNSVVGGYIRVETFASCYHLIERAS